MPTYSYACNKCDENFELFFYIKDYNDKPLCPKCKNNKLVTRNYQVDISSQATTVKKTDNELKTIGDLANRNRDRMSEDERNHLQTKHNAYKETDAAKPLPKGMTRMPKGKKIKWT